MKEPSKLPYTFNEIKSRFSLRKSQEKILELAEKSFRENKYDEAIMLYKRVRDFSHHTREKSELNENIKEILKHLEKKEAPAKTTAPKKEKPPETPPAKPPVPAESETQNDPGFNIKIENITLSGLEVNAGNEIIKMIKKVLPQAASKEDTSSTEDTTDTFIPDDLYQPHEKSDPYTQKAVEDIKEEFQAQIQHHTHSHHFSQTPLDNLPDSKEWNPQEEQNSVSSPSSAFPGESGSFSPIAPEMKDIYAKSEKTTPPKSQDSDKARTNPFQVDAKLSPGENEDDKPIKVEQVAPKPKIEKVKPLNLTYNFTNVFHNKFYFKYSDMFNEAAQLVRERKLDDAIEYYQVLLDQRLPETMKAMIRQNIGDLQEAIINTFKQADTIVKMDNSGKLHRLDSMSSVRVLDDGRSGSKDDIFFKE